MTGAGMMRKAAFQIDEGLDIPGLVNHAFASCDEMAAQAATAFSMAKEIPEAPAPTRSAVHDGVGNIMPEDDDSGMDLEDDPDLGIGEQGEVPTVDNGHSFLHQSAQTLLFAGARVSSLTATLVLLNLCRTHGTSNMFITELLTVLGMSILPELNTLPKTEYMASKVLRQLGLSYNIIHCCPNNCMLYSGEHNREVRNCSSCGAPRFRPSSGSDVPWKVLRHFPLIPRLQRMFSTPAQAKLQTWWLRHKSQDVLVRGAFDSEQWSKAEQFDPTFTNDPRNVRLGLATDGLNPFSIKRSTWSTWPVLLLNYNIPPWLRMKKHFVMLALLIPGPRSVTSAQFNMFLEPLLQELLELWSPGVIAVDASQGSREFILRAILLWTIHDFPAYGIVSGLVTKGFVGCPVCGPATTSRHSSALKKCVYDHHHRKWLPENHPWRSSLAFHGTTEFGSAPVRLTAEEVVAAGRLRDTFLASGGAPKRDDPARIHGVNRVSSLFRLPYWSVSKSTVPTLFERPRFHRCC